MEHVELAVLKRALFEQVTEVYVPKTETSFPLSAKFWVGLVFRKFPQTQAAKPLRL
uniref:Uncharacterized protein n=1 Tax=Anguilla anguilla TaxID=7936 RepID=A0A0E9RYN5_ANGAN